MSVQLLKEITREWIVENFDIDKERKERKKLREWPLDSLFDNLVSEKIDILDFFRMIAEEVEEFKAQYNLNSQDIKIGLAQSWENNYYDLVAETREWETDDQTISRLLKNEKAKIRRKLPKEAKDYETYVKLHKKFGKGELKK